MTIDLLDFWDPTLPAAPPVTPAQVRYFEQQLSVVLPAELLALLARQNGGATRGFAFPTAQPTSWADNHVPLNEVIGLVPPAAGPGQPAVLNPDYLTQEWGLPARQVLLSGDGHWFITLDYRHGPAPTVAWIDTEMDQDLQLAPSFAAFLAGLVPADRIEDEEPD